MINSTVFLQVKCSFCKKTFCCAKCRIGHESKSHSNEKKEEEHFCYLCEGQKLPFGSGYDEISPEKQQHIVDFHFPLRCDKCEKTFDTIEDLKSVGKCCKPVTVEDGMADKLSEKENLEKLSEIDREKPLDKPLTPLAQMNMRWRRKSVEFAKVESHLQVVNEENLARQTSTPRLQGNLLTTKHFTDSSTYSASSIHLSSINITSGSTSSDSDAFSPPVSEAPKQLMAQPISPQRVQRPTPPTRSRSKLNVQATPLRQVMTKSIQRAIQQHGHYRQSPFTLQQRKMSFNSTGSSNETTSSLMKLGDASPLDLRMSPALRRSSNPSEKFEVAIDNSDLIDLHSQVGQQLSIEEIVIIRRREIKSETSAASSNYRSVLSDTVQSDSMPEIHATPKIVGNNFLKKTISFVTPDDRDKSPGLLTTVVDDEDDEDNDVFYTPRTSPKRFPRTFRSEDEQGHSSKKADDSKSHGNLWNLVTSVMQLAAKKGEDISESLNNSDGLFKFSFRKPDFVKKATDFFTGRSESSCEEQPSKRRRTSSNAENRVASPLMKRQKIQARKPIDRMRRLS